MFSSATGKARTFAQPKGVERLPRTVGQQPVGVRIEPQDDNFEPKGAGRRYQDVGLQPVGVRIPPKE